MRWKKGLKQADFIKELLFMLHKRLNRGSGSPSYGLGEHIRPETNKILIYLHIAVSAKLEKRQELLECSNFL